MRGQRPRLNAGEVDHRLPRQPADASMARIFPEQSRLVEQAPDRRGSATFRRRSVSPGRRSQSDSPGEANAAPQAAARHRRSIRVRTARRGLAFSTEQAPPKPVSPGTDVEHVRSPPALLRRVLRVRQVIQCQSGHRPARRPRLLTPPSIALTDSCDTTAWRDSDASNTQQPG
jgi:hypothetical protein